MEPDSQQLGGGYPVFCTECHMYDYMPLGHKSWVCPRCKELQGLRERICSLEAKVADLEKQKQAVRVHCETSGDLQASSLPRRGSSSAAGERSLRAGGRQPGTVGILPPAGTPSSSDEPASSRTKDAPRREGGCGLLVVGDSIIRNIERGVCDGRGDRTVTCLPGAKVADITSRIDRLVRSAGEEVAVVVHVGTNDVGRCSREVLEAKFKLLGRSLKARTPKVAFSEVLPVPRAGPARQAELRGLNAWMRRWCREEGFRFVRHWGTFWDKPGLYKRDGLHLNQNGTRLLALNIKKVAEQLLN